MKNIVLKKVSPDAIGLLQAIGRQTFSETFSPYNSEENMKKYLEEGFSFERLKAELMDKNAVFYFAWIDQSVAGYLKLNFGPSQTEIRDDKAVEIERIYVLKEFQGQKVGQALFEKAMQIAKQAGASYIWLGVWEENLRAISFYRKNGFEVFDKHLFVLGKEEQTDLMMRLQLQ